MSASTDSSLRSLSLDVWTNHIFTNLGSWRNLLAAALVCKAWSRAASDSRAWRRLVIKDSDCARHASSSLNRHPTVTENRHVFAAVPSYRRDFVLLTLVRLACGSQDTALHLHTLELQNCVGRYHMPCLEAAFDRLPNLRKLSMTNFADEGANSVAEVALCKCPKLRKLRLVTGLSARAPFDPASSIRNTSVQSLTIRSGRWLKFEETLPALLRRLPGLTSVDIRAIGLASAQNFTVPVEVVAAYGSQLRCLRLKHPFLGTASNRLLELLPALGELERLSLRQVRSFGDRDAEQVAALCPNLQALTLDDLGLGDYGMEQLACRLPFLTKIKVLNCHRVTDNGYAWLRAAGTNLRRMDLLPDPLVVKRALQCLSDPSIAPVSKKAVVGRRILRVRHRVRRQPAALPDSLGAAKGGAEQGKAVGEAPRDGDEGPGGSPKATSGDVGIHVGADNLLQVDHADEVATSTRIPPLRHLSLRGKTNLHVPALRCFKHLTQFRANVEGVPWPEVVDVFHHLPKLEKLVLWSGHFTDEALLGIAAAPFLRRLRVFYAPALESVYRALLCHMENLRMVSLICLKWNLSPMEYPEALNRVFSVLQSSCPLLTGLDVRLHPKAYSQVIRREPFLEFRSLANRLNGCFIRGYSMGQATSESSYHVHHGLGPITTESKEQHYRMLLRSRGITHVFFNRHISGSWELIWRLWSDVQMVAYTLQHELGNSIAPLTWKDVKVCVNESNVVCGIQFGPTYRRPLLPYVGIGCVVSPFMRWLKEKSAGEPILEHPILARFGLYLKLELSRVAPDRRVVLSAELCGNVQRSSPLGANQPQ